MSKAGVASFCGRCVERLEKDVFHKNAGNFPGVVAKKLDSDVLSKLAEQITDASVVVSATNGKTTTTNMLANCIEARGVRVFCNRDGSNLDTGIITTLLKRESRSHAVFECDELYTKYVLLRIKPRYFMLLNLFPDQVDRFGGIYHIQDTFVEALEKTPDTIVVYNADDPYCEAVAQRISNKTISFGMDYKACTDMAPGAVTHACDSAPSQEEIACSACGTTLSYASHIYGQLGDFTCPDCGMTRVAPDFEATDIQEIDGGYTFNISSRGKALATIQVPVPGLYMVYNVLAVCVMANMLGVDFETIQQCIHSFNPRNGRLQTYTIGKRTVISNLAKNPVGFNQNIDIILKSAEPCAVGFWVNNNEGDGRDIEWLQDVNFEALTPAYNNGMPVFVGGMVEEDLLKRLEAAGICARTAPCATDMLTFLNDNFQDSTYNRVYMIANYTALPPIHRELESLEKGK